MNALRRCWSIILRLLALPLVLSCIAFSPAFADGIEVPFNQKLALALTGQGVQIYKCSAMPGMPNKFEWALKGPEADLFDADGRKVGRHFAGPTWELNDGGKVLGRVKFKVDAPDGKGVPWLLLDAVQANGTIMGTVKSIQRVNTVGGQAPSEPADAINLDQEKRVKYVATYKFYVAKSSE